MNWYLKVLKNYSGFRGRARRKEYWMFALFSTIITLVLSVIDSAAGFTFSEDAGVLSTIYGLLILVPTIAVMARRLHDTNRSAWWILIGLVPLIGALVLLVFFCLKGSDGENRFGPDPLAEDAQMTTVA
ncbi:DUF805 domain-containing protein [Apirhabdus apintestini]|uniref:DUF805 domain-containing protein n=1 Tax=Erwinia sp. HR93 TaxID=3094840 RepID=UPI002ADEE1E4|nr:DUF805 domain-containing protein [Erwinia sp. HR93]MEA1063412.1 DUF805 domain-containing protein [Erwinia sp. HR93]WPM85218.1 DUF805 domain-containing protein [Enterobacteriaceae bacterium CA-0114]